jgi:protein-L-isoaspartate(D-aspartate) O-methyltransferase
MIHDHDHTAAKERMIQDNLISRGIKDKRVIDAMRAVPREAFVLPQDQADAYADVPLPIGSGQTISQPYMVAYMAEQLRIKPTDTVLEIGTGSGYGAAILGQLAGNVYTMEIVEDLYQRASKILQRLQYKNIVCYLRDGYAGLEEHAPFDKIILTAAPVKVPTVLLHQLRVGGTLIAPLGDIKIYQRLSLFEKTGPDEYKETELMGVSFVEMVHENEDWV